MLAEEPPMAQDAALQDAVQLQQMVDQAQDGMIAQEASQVESKVSLHQAKDSSVCKGRMVISCLISCCFPAYGFCPFDRVCLSMSRDVTRKQYMPQQICCLSK